ncbi:MAG: sel1 repeat family protein [Gammaproteobacteria bacterium]|nr:sel1 repeat family protein [Gammaproteobacteria bacterium]
MMLHVGNHNPVGVAGCRVAGYFVLTLLLVALAGCGGSADHGAAGSTQTSSPAALVTDSDQTAAHPDDPLRMAPGVATADIVPRLALIATEEAVRAHPREPRFHFQHGRALAVSGRQSEALEAYQRAADMGYPMAYFKLGLAYATGEGVAMDIAKAREWFERAEAGGVGIAASARNYYVFSTEGFSNPQLFQLIFDGNLRELQADRSDLAGYLVSFMEPFRGTEGCGIMISRGNYSKLVQMGQANVVSMMFRGMADSRSQTRPGDFAGSAQSGFRAGQQFGSDLGALVDQGEADAQLFYDRFDCRSPVADRFFENIDRLAGTF